MLEDGGANVTVPLPSVNAFAVVGVAPKFFAATQSGLFKSTNGGANWTLIAAGDYRSVTQRGETVVATPTGGINNVKVSLDGGNTFSTYTVSSSNSVTALWSSFIDIDGTIYVGGQNGGGDAKVYSSTYHGSSWTLLLNVVGGSNVEKFEIHDGIMYAAVSARGLYRKPVINGTWDTFCCSPCANPGTLPSNVASDLKVKNGVLCVGTSAGLAVSPDLGRTWENYATGKFSGMIRRISIPSDTLYYAASSVANGMRPSDNRGPDQAFPSGPSYGWPIMPPVGGFSELRPFAASIAVYANPDCTNKKREFYFPEGLSASSTADSAFRYDAGAVNRIFLRDF